MYATNLRRTNNDPFYDAARNFFNNEFWGVNNAPSFTLDLKESDSSYMVVADLPGVQKQDIKLDYNNEVLSIEVTTPEEQTQAVQKTPEPTTQADVTSNSTEAVAVEDSAPTQETFRYIHRERRNVAMKRGIHLKNVRVEDITATLKDGVLEILVPKVANTALNYKIEIQ